MHAWVMGANMNLPGDISVTWAKSMPAHFDARFCAQARRYRYVIYNDQIRPAHMAEEVTWNHRPLDIERMRQAASALSVPMTSVHSGRASVRPSRRSKPCITLKLLQHGRFIVLDIRANAFLHHMVRNLAGVLMTIGAGERPVEWAQEVLETRVRRTGGVTAHPLWAVFGAGRLP